MIEDIVLTDQTSGVSISINTSSGPLYTEEIVIEPVQANHSSYPFPGQDGEFIESTVFSTRTVSITAWIVANELHDVGYYKKILNKMINPKHTLVITYREYDLTFYADDSIQYSTIRKENNDVVCKFLITGVAYNPFWISQSKLETPLSYIDLRFILPFHMIRGEWVLGVSQPAALASLDYDGEPTGCIISITAKGSVKNPKVICIETQQKFEIEKTLVDGEQIEIDTILGQRGVKGILNNQELNYMQYMSSDSSWIDVNKGVNTFSFSAEEGQEVLSIYLTVISKYLEVEDD